MLDQTEINLGRFTFWFTTACGIGILIANVIHHVDGVGFVGLALIIGACGLGTRRTIAEHDRAMKDAFNLGREHERLQSVRTRV